MLKALLFDIDGTLVETDTLHYEIWRKVLAEENLAIDNAAYKEKISGRLNPDIVRDLLPHLSPEQQVAFAEHKEAVFRQQVELQPLDGLVDCLRWASDRSLIRAVVSNAPKANAEFMLQSLNVASAFSLVVLGGELPYGKPHPLPYQEALRLLDLSAEEAIAFEDSPSGIQSAVAAGIAVVGIASTHDPAELKSMGAAIVVKDFADALLMEWLNLQLDA
ncbi:MAG TPA: HAD-IA family hydrolase [Coleofasciculaceae cyanobacterium]|jgi:beta-phosphoglucomutase